MWINEWTSLRISERKAWRKAISALSTLISICDNYSVVYLIYLMPKETSKANKPFCYEFGNGKDGTRKQIGWTGASGFTDRDWMKYLGGWSVKG